MTKLSDEQFNDLGKLATERINNALVSVFQLIDDQEDISALMHTIIHSMCMGAAEHRNLYFVWKDGSRMPVNEAYFEVLIELTKMGDARALREIKSKKFPHV